MGLLEGLTGELISKKVITSLSKTTDAKSSQIQNLLGMAVPILLQNMQKNASSSSGASSLAKALDSHADDTDNVTSLLKNVDLSEGAKIIKHILGKNTQKTEESLAEKSGLSISQVASALSAIAPVLLSLLGTQKKQNNTNISSLFSALSGASGKGSVAGSILSAVMKDGDGDKKSDLLQMAKGLFGKK